MNSGELKQGQALSALGMPNYNAESTWPWIVGEHYCESITVTRLAGPMGWYDCAKVEFSNGKLAQIVPLHHCDFIVPAP